MKPFRFSNEARNDASRIRYTGILVIAEGRTGKPEIISDETGFRLSVRWKDRDGTEYIYQSNPHTVQDGAVRAAKRMLSEAQNLFRKISATP